jgi:hypothetical protein
MRKLILAVAIVTSLLFSMVSIPALATGAPAEDEFTKEPTNPVLTGVGAWESDGVAAGSVILDGSTYKMWYSGYDDDGITQIGYATSTNGIDWDKYAGNPVLHVGTPGNWDSFIVGGPSVIKDGATYKMWYTGSNSSLIGRIGYATSTDGINWVKYASYVLNVGAAGTWEENGVLDPSVIKDGPTYKMWYSGRDVDGSILGLMAIGYATSNDGLVWYKGSNPVMTKNLTGFDNRGVGGTHVIKETAGTYTMYYTGFETGTGLLSEIGIAASSNGLSWTRQATPVLKVGDGGSWEEEGVGDPCVIVTSSTIGLWYTGTNNYEMDGTNPPYPLTQIGYASKAVPPPPGITVTSPDGGESWAPGSTHNITWTYTTTVPTWVRIELYKGGNPVKTIAPFWPRGAAGSGSYSWAIPPGQAAGNDYRIKITSTSKSSVYDTSNLDFSIGVTPTYTITVSPGANGSITPPTGSVADGAEPVYTITANPGYHITDVLVNGGSVGAVDSYTFAPVHVDQTISATFDNTHTITVSHGANGSITPDTGPVVDGDTPVYTIAANPGYHIADVLVDGVSKGAVSSYTFDPVHANHTISATFIANNHTITVSAGANGSITPGTGSVVDGAMPVYAIAANPGYHITDVLVNGVSKGAVSSYTFDPVHANHTISATFIADNHTITVSAGANGSITPGTMLVADGAEPVYTITANPGYHVSDVLVDGGSVGPVSSYTFDPVHASYTISATFAINTYTITVSAGANGTITPGTGSVTYNATPTYTIAANPGCYIANVLVDGVSKGAVSSYTFDPVHANHTISATFATDSTPRITVTSPDGGENWAPGSTHNITWTYSNVPTWVRIELYKGGTLVKTIAPFWPRGAAGSGSYSWVIPPGQATGSDYRIKIVSTSKPVFDTSNADFSIGGVR